jgi:hypothetical protein
MVRLSGCGLSEGDYPEGHYPEGDYPEGDYPEGNCRLNVLFLDVPVSLTVPHACLPLIAKCNAHCKLT